MQFHSRRYRDATSAALQRKIAGIGITLSAMFKRVLERDVFLFAFNGSKAGADAVSRVRGTSKDVPCDGERLTDCSHLCYYGREFKEVI